MATYSNYSTHCSNDLTVKNIGWRIYHHDIFFCLLFLVGLSIEINESAREYAVETIMVELYI